MLAGGGAIAGVARGAWLPTTTGQPPGALLGLAPSLGRLLLLGRGFGWWVGTGGECPSGKRRWIGDAAEIWRAAAAAAAGARGAATPTGRVPSPLSLPLCYHTVWRCKGRWCTRKWLSGLGAAALGGGQSAGTVVGARRRRRPPSAPPRTARCCRLFPPFFFPPLPLVSAPPLHKRVRRKASDLAVGWPPAGARAGRVV